LKYRDYTNNPSGTLPSQNRSYPFRYTEPFPALFFARAARQKGTIVMASPAVDFARSNQPRFLNELKDLLRIPSISTLEEHKSDVQKAAEFVANELRRIGMNNVEVIATQGHPLIYADWLHASGMPTVLMYAHYDVQPADPIDEWHTPPFEPTERNDNIYARGAVDDKGQLWMEVKALESLMQAHGGKLPINVKVIFEGEEETGGESIAEYVRKQKAKLKADFALVCDTELFAPNLPTLCVGLRGLVYTEIEAYGAKTDLHSGVYGGAAPNPFFALIEIISKLKDSKGKVLIPGFYSKVKAPSKDELKAWKRLPFNEEHYRKTEVGSKVLTGESGFSVLYRTWARPTLEVHGMPGGFTAAGAKTVIPAKGAAKVSMRLVPNQDPDDILKRYTAYVKKLTPKGIETKIKVHSKGPACVVGTDNEFIRAATESLHDVFKKETVFIRSGGSIPIVTDFQDVLKIPSVMMGFGLPDDNLHAPNEKFHIPNFYRGIETICVFFEKLGG
jgi:acetylornithine deacetylase/succinyl-diaminopimelate desuccinylase-like protein